MPNGLFSNRFFVRSGERMGEADRGRIRERC